MDAIDRYELLSQAINLLDQRVVEPEGVYFFCGDADDQGVSYCYDCIKVIKPDAVFGWSDDFMGGSTNDEQDGCETCEHCGKVLGYTLTDYGISSELQNFVEYGFDWSSPQECYEIARVVHGMVSTDPRRDDVLKVLLSGKNVPSEMLASTPHPTSDRDAGWRGVCVLNMRVL